MRWKHHSGTRSSSEHSQRKRNHGTHDHRSIPRAAAERHGAGAAVEEAALLAKGNVLRDRRVDALPAFDVEVHQVCVSMVYARQSLGYM